MSESDSASENRAALVDSQGKVLTHGKLNQSIRAFSDLLWQFRIGGGCRIAILLEKSFASAITIYASQEIAAAYIPIDINLPSTRTRQIIADCDPHVIVHSNPDFFPGQNSIPCPIEGMEGTFVTSLLLPNYESKETAPNYFTTRIAYILYTSGSTGIPKGVCVSFEAANAFVEWCTSTFEIKEGENVASIAPFHFDLSVFDLFATRHKKATLHLFRSQEVQNLRLMSELLSSKSIHTIYATPTFYSALLEFGKPEKHLWLSIRNVLFAGEVFPVKVLHRLMDLWSSATFYNLYGPTETNVCTYTEITKDENRSLPYPIGLPCTNHSFEITADAELLVGGAHVANEYLNQPDLTAEKFFVRGSTRWFRTGDRVEQTADGQLLFKGRLDRMIKRRGYRIEPAEIETAITRLQGFTSAAVVSISGADDVVRLIAVVTTTAGISVELPQFKVLLSQFLPEYMLPDGLKKVDVLPTTSSGKVDYAALLREVVSSF